MYHMLPLRIEANRVRALEFPRSFAHRADERALGVEFEQRVIAAIEKKYVALGIDGDADHFAQYVGGRVMKKVFDKMQRQLRRRGVVTLHAYAALRASRRGTHNAEEPRQTELAK